MALRFDFERKLRITWKLLVVFWCSFMCWCILLGSVSGIQVANRNLWPWKLFLSLHAYRHAENISFTVCPQFFVTGISGVGWRKAMKFGGAVDLGGYQIMTPTLVNFDPGLAPKAKKWQKQMQLRGDQHLGIYASRDNWRACTCIYIWVLLPK